MGAAEGGGAEGGVEGDVADGAGGDGGAEIVSALLRGDGFAAAASARLGAADGSRRERLVEGKGCAGRENLVRRSRAG
ncbi:MAG: hypothetical protein KDJ65_20250 [Anaerolineae bacterium]|nr:hypothetical protein [Anaerolineae bacterium]